MPITNLFLELHELTFKAYHGVFEEEHAVGGIYIADIRLEGDFARACESDDLCDTVDYARVCSLVKQEIKVESALIEHVAARIGQRLLDDLPRLSAVTVTLRKQRPPVIGADLREACVTLTCTRSV